MSQTNFKSFAAMASHISAKDRADTLRKAEEPAQVAGAGERQARHGSASRTMTGILNLSDLVALEVVCRAAQTCARVKWLTDDGDIVSGTARHLVRSADDIGFITGEDDVREVCPTDHH